MNTPKEESVQDGNLERSIDSLFLGIKDAPTLPEAGEVASTDQPKFSIYKRDNLPMPIGEQTPYDLCEEIRSQKYEEQCKVISKLKVEMNMHEAGSKEYISLKEEHKKAKSKLPCVTPSGAFKSRANEKLIAHTGLAQLDIDGGDNPQPLSEIKKIVTNDPHTHIAFLSPSKDGYKALVKFSVTDDGSGHKECYSSLIDYYKQTYGLKIDGACKDVSRAMYLSSDKDIFTRPLGEVAAFQPKEVEVVESKPVRQYQLTTQTQSYWNSRTPDEEAKICLSHLDPDMSYPDWRAVGAGCHAKGVSFSVWDSWSQRGTKYQPDVCDNEWGRFNAGGGINFGTVVEMATRANGGIDPLNVSRERAVVTANDFSVIEGSDSTQNVRTKIEFFRPSELSFDELEDDDLVENLLGQKVLSCIYAPPESGKTFVALDIGASVANGTPWHGRDVEQGAVIYIGLEGRTGVRRRLKAMKSEGIIDDNTPLIASPSHLDLGDHECVSNWIRAMANEHKDIRLIIIDTLLRACASGQLSDSKDMSEAVAHATTMMEVIGCAVLLVHHAGKDASKKEFGSIALRASLDTSIFVKRDDAGVIEVRPDKQKDMARGEGMNMFFTLEEVCVGSTKKGKMVTSCVLREAESSNKGEQAQKQKASDMLDMIDSLNEAVNRQGRTVTTTEWDALSQEDVGLKKWKASAYRKELYERGDVIRTQDGRAFYWEVNPAKFDDGVISKSS